MVAASEGAEKVVRRVAVVHLFQGGRFFMTLDRVYTESEAAAMAKWWTDSGTGFVGQVEPCELTCSAQPVLAAAA